MIPVFFCCFIVFTFWLRYKLKHAAGSSAVSSEEFWNRERESNFIPKKDISDLDYIQVPLQEFPFRDDTSDEALIDWQNKVRAASEKKMLNLTGFSNTDLKFAYGSANYPLLADYDQNFTVFIRNLFGWAKYLSETGDITAARQLLEFGVTCRSDISGNYTLLADIYLKEDDLDSFRRLQEQASHIPGARKEAICASLSALLQQYS